MLDTANSYSLLF